MFNIRYQLHIGIAVDQEEKHLPLYRPAENGRHRSAPAVFQFADSRSKEMAEKFLQNYCGTIIRDMYSGYEDLPLEHAGCWAHVRRKFFDAEKAGYSAARPFLNLIRSLYEIERHAKDRSEEKNAENALYAERRIATHEENTELFPEAEQEVLEDGSIKLTLRVDSKRIDGHRHLVWFSTSRCGYGCDHRLFLRFLAGGNRN